MDKWAILLNQICFVEINAFFSKSDLNFMMFIKINYNNSSNILKPLSNQEPLDKNFHRLLVNPPLIKKL